MPTIIPFPGLKASEIPLVGGKGANLAAMAQAGFPVPAGFIVTTAAYDAFVRRQNRPAQLRSLVEAVADGRSPLLEKAAAQIRTLFLADDLPGEVVAELEAAYDELGGGPVAVRSSATAEDLPQASFAGQHETVLNVQGTAPLLAAVRACWASLWSARAVAYRERMGIDHGAASMAVVVQVMAPAEVAGILFTANPTTGARDELVINASYGLGEAVVAGQVTPDTLVLHRQNLTVKQMVLGAKSLQVIPAGQQGTTTQPVSPDRRRRPALSPALRDRLAALALEVEAHFGDAPQDIEWAVADGECWLLQSRPITNLPPPPLDDVRWEPLRPGTVWMRRQIVEHMPEPLSPLFDELYLRAGLDESLETMAAYMGELSGFEINLWDFLDPPFAATVNGYAYSIASFNFSWRLVPLTLRLYIVALPKMLRYLLPRWRDESLPAYLAAIAEWKALDLAQAPDEALLEGVRALATEDARYWFAAAVPLGLARITDAALDRFLKLATAAPGDGVHLTSGAFLRGFPSQAAAAQAQLEAVARQINRDGALRERLLDTPAPGWLDVLVRYPQVMMALQQYLDTYGHQIYNLDFAAPTLADDPRPVWLSLKMAVLHPERDIRAQQAGLAREREALQTKTEQALSPLLRPVFRRLLGWAQQYAPYREQALFYVGAGWPALRRLALELGRRLTAAGALAAPDDVFFLHTAELAAASSARAEGAARPDLARLARERRDLQAARRRLEPPAIVPPDGRMKFGPIDMAMFEPRPRHASVGPVLDGFAVSPGQATAPASVIRGPEAFDQMAADTILVCPTTTPAWTPLFARARGLVTDIGGALAHGSIVAREYGIPAVMGTGDATRRIRSGQRIRVDGDRGLVTLVDEIDPAAPAATDRRAAPTGSGRWRRALLAVALLAGGLVWWKRRRSHS